MCRPAVYAARAHCGPRSWGASQPFTQFEHHHFPGFGHSPGLGVRRPLRFLAWKLQLDEPQVKQLATILDQLKIERAQAEVDDRRAVSLLAEAAEGEAFDRSKADEAGALRTKSAEQVQRKVVESVERLHALLNPEQRARLAYLLRTGSLVM
jgi:Spy/CpxP family protein refolding chaperone